MAYTLSASGRKSDVIGELRQKAASQSAALPSQGERDNLEGALKEAEDMVSQYAGDNDSVSVTIGGHISQSDTALAMSKNLGVSISRGAGAEPPGAPTTTGTAPAADRRQPNPRI